MASIRRGWRVDWVGLGEHAVWLAYWATVIFIWGYWKWRTAEFGSPEWWFDALAHALFSTTGAVNLIYEINYFRPTALYGHPVKRALILHAVVPLVIIGFAVGWEGVEAYHDQRSVNIIAQKGDPDTTIDIALALPFSYLGVLTYKGYHSYRRRRNPSLALEEKIAELRARRNEWKKEGKALKREIRQLERETGRKQLWRDAKDVFRDKIPKPDS